MTLPLIQPGRTLLRSFIARLLVTGALALAGISSARATLIYAEDFDDVARPMGSVPAEMGVHQAGGATVGVSDAQYRTGGRSLYFKLIDNPDNSHGDRNYRAEVVLTKVPGLPGHAVQYRYETEYWVGFSEYLKDWAPDRLPESVLQSHMADYYPEPGDRCLTGLNAYTLMTMNGRLSVRLRTDDMCPSSGSAFPNEKYSFNDIPTPNNQWVDWVFHFKNSLAGNGFWEIYQNGKLVYRAVNLRNAQDRWAGCCNVAVPGNRQYYYPKFGIYKAQWKFETSDVTQRELYVDNIKIWEGPGGKLEDMMPATEKYLPRPGAGGTTK